MPRFVSLLALLSLGCAVAGAKPSVVERALDADQAAIASLRAKGPDGLAKLLTHRGDDLRWDQLIDEVAQQRDASVSGLYWYTDLEEAKAVAAETGKPIVSLRLLGSLTDELSCANSRFFRTVLYPDPAVRSWLSDNAVLHWSSERPAPVATIDFGDGRVMRRTITGNSGHLVLDADGRPLDIIPGLYGPAAFLAELEAAKVLHGKWTEAEAEQRSAVLNGWHAESLDQSVEALGSQIQFALQGFAGVAQLRQMMLRSPVEDPEPVQISAIIPMQMAVTKAAPEMSILRGLGVEGTPILPSGMTLTDSQWTQIEMRQPQPVLSEASLALIASENPGMDLDPMLVALRESIRKDTVFNEYRLHAQVHEAFWSGEVSDFEGAVAWMYSDLFETPRSDPWMGMFDPTAYTALEGGGVRQTQVQAAR